MDQYFLNINIYLQIKKKEKQFTTKIIDTLILLNQSYFNCGMLIIYAILELFKTIQNGFYNFQNSKWQFSTC